MENGTLSNKGKIITNYPNMGSVRMALALNKAFDL